MDTHDAPSYKPPGIALTEAQARTVRAIIDSVLPDAEVWVFGSRATGHARPFSDLDLLLTQPRSLSWLQRADLRDAFEASELPFKVDVVEAEGLSGVTKERVNVERVLLRTMLPRG